MMKLDVLFGCEWLVQDLLTDRRYGWADGGVCRGGTFMSLYGLYPLNFVG